MQYDSNDLHTHRLESQSGDHSITSSLARAWDASYQDGRYSTEPALGFADDIIKELKTRPNLMKGCGLYVGCGNGRNYVKLAESGLNVTGIDISRVALAELSKKLPQCSALLHRCDLLDYLHDVPFQYVIAIQVFQHGNMDRVERYFEKASTLLERNGLLFLRVNASNTVIQYDHDVIEENDTGGFTVCYKEGPKKGLNICFLSKEDINDLMLKNNMSIMRRLKNATTGRVRPCQGSWSQWEIVAKKC